VQLEQCLEDNFLQPAVILERAGNPQPKRVVMQGFFGAADNDISTLQFFRK